jgi:hypothetical protein
MFDIYCSFGVEPSDPIRVRRIDDELMVSIGNVRILFRDLEQVGRVSTALRDGAKLLAELHQRASEVPQELS